MLEVSLGQAVGCLADNTPTVACKQSALNRSSASGTSWASTLRRSGSPGAPACWILSLTLTGRPRPYCPPRPGSAAAAPLVLLVGQGVHDHGRDLVHELIRPARVQDAREAAHLAGPAARRLARRLHLRARRTASGSSGGSCRVWLHGEPRPCAPVWTLRARCHSCCPCAATRGARRATACYRPAPRAPLPRNASDFSHLNACLPRSKSPCFSGAYRYSFPHRLASS